MDDELLSLDRDIAALDGQQNAPAVAAKAEAATSAAEGWAEIPQAVGVFFTLALPETKDAFKDEACLEWGKHMARVAEKHGWSSDGMPPEVTLLLSTLGFALPVGLAVMTRRAKKREKPEGLPNGDANKTD